MYLSRLILNPSSRQVRAELAQPYEMHRTLMRAFPEVLTEADGKAREKFDILFRSDVDDRHHRVIVYVQSAVKPDWSYLGTISDYLLDDPSNPALKEISGNLQGLHRGQVLAFRLRANPTKRVAKADGGSAELKGKRVGLLREEEQVDWLIRKGRQRTQDAPGGFEILMTEVEGRTDKVRYVPRVNVRLEGKRRSRKRENNHSYRTTHLAVRFDGLLRITDADAFRQTLAKGIGPAKAYGFGLMSIAPAR